MSEIDTSPARDDDVNVRTERPDFLAELQGFATMCERSLSPGDGPMLAARFREAASLISIAVRQCAEDRTTLRTVGIDGGGLDDLLGLAVAVAEADKVEITAWRTRAVRAEAALAARKPCDPADPCPVAQDIASENRTLDNLLAEAKERAKDAEARAERMRATQAVSTPAPGIYVASKTTHGPMWRYLRSSGWPIISTWIDESEVGATANLADLWCRCVEEARTASVLVVYREAGETLKGAWVEVGAALAAGRPVYAVGCDEFSVCNHPRVTRVQTLAHAMDLARAALADQEADHA